MGRRERKKEKRTQLWMGIFVIFLMATSIFGIIVGSNSNGSQTYRYEGHAFYVNENNLYESKINDKTMEFYSLPDQLEKTSDEIINKIKNSPSVKVTFDPTDTENLQYIEVARFGLSSYTDENFEYGITKASATYNFPIVTCEDATAESPVLIFEKTEEINLYMENNCIHVQGDLFEFLMHRDSIIYSYYGILK
jgi:hypothetical protein